MRHDHQEGSTTGQVVLGSLRSGQASEWALRDSNPRPAGCKPCRNMRCAYERKSKSTGVRTRKTSRPIAPARFLRPPRASVHRRGPFPGPTATPWPCVSGAWSTSPRQPKRAPGHRREAGGRWGHAPTSDLPRSMSQRAAPSRKSRLVDGRRGSGPFRDRTLVGATRHMPTSGNHHDRCRRPAQKHEVRRLCQQPTIEVLDGTRGHLGRIPAPGRRSPRWFYTIRETTMGRSKDQCSSGPSNSSPTDS